MAGYYIYTLDAKAFTQLTTAPTDAQAMILARGMVDQLEASDAFPANLNGLAAAIKQRLAMPDWYSDLSEDDTVTWDDIVFSLREEPGEELGIGFECSDYESIYWDCAQQAASHGAKMMEEPVFGNSGYRYFGPPDSDFGYQRMYSIFEGAQVQELLKQLKLVEPHFAAMSDDDLDEDGDDFEEGSLYEQFFEGLLAPVQQAAANDRVLFVQTDT